MKSFDERQLLLRGNAFKHAFFLLGFLLLAENLLYSLIGSVHIFGNITNIVLFAMVTVVTVIELIFRHAYEYEKDDKKALSYLMIAACAIALIVNTVHMIELGNFLNSNEGRETLGMIIIDLCVIMIGIYYLYDMHKRKKESEEE